jgi:hypothetical protein
LPLDADDLAGLAALYPTEHFLATTGTIRGQVLTALGPANLASVVAVALDGTAIGAMTGPDGRYEIQGLPSGEYRVYAHALPPAQSGEAHPGAIVPPQDLRHVPFTATQDFATRFYPGTMAWQESTRVPVSAKQAVTDVDFALGPQAGAGVYNVRMFGYLGARQTVAVHAAPLPLDYNYWLSFEGPGTKVDGGIAPGLHLSAVSDAVMLNDATLRTYPGSDNFLLIGARGREVSRATPVTVAFTVGERLYVRPHAFSIVPSKHPALLTTSPLALGGDTAGTVRVLGENLQGRTVLLDGVEAAVSKVRDDGSLEVVVPPTVGPRSAVIEVLSGDGQTSNQLRGSEPPVRYVYERGVELAAQVRPTSVTAATTAMLEVTVPGAHFAVGATVGFGTSDVAVRQLWVVSPEKLLLNVSMHARAQAGVVRVTVQNGLEQASGSLVVRAAEEHPRTVLLPLVNDLTGLRGAPVGGTISLRATDIPASIAGWSATLGGVRTPLTRSEDGRLLVFVPLQVGLGPQAVEISTNGGVAYPPVLFQIDSAPPQILDLRTSRPKPGEVVTLIVRNLETSQTGELDLRIGGVAQVVTGLEELADSTVRLTFTLSPDTPVGDGQIWTLRVGTRQSPKFVAPIVARP